MRVLPRAVAAPTLTRGRGAPARQVRVFANNNPETFFNESFREDKGASEGARSVSLKEQLLEPAELKLLAGLLVHNKAVTELDLTATDADAAGAKQLATVLEANTTVTSLKLAYNPAVDDDAKAALKAVAAARVEPPLALEL